MKKNLATLFITVLIFSNLNAQKLNSSQDSITAFYNSMVLVMKSEYLYKEKVNWPKLELELKDKLDEFSDFKSSLEVIPTIFDITEANHCTVMYNNDKFTGTYEGPTKKDFSDQWIKKFATKPIFEVKVLDNQFGYILMPAMGFEDRSKKNIHKQTQPMYDEINKIKNSNTLKGWIIDLRFNSGGDCLPMLLVLYDFLGNNDVWGGLDINNEQISSVKLNKGKYISDSKTISYIKPKGELLDKVKVAVITNIATASSGEITAMAFKGRENTIFIGQNTMGMTTTNTRRDLPFGAYMALTIGYDCDRNGEFYEQIIPDISMLKQDNFDDLLLDENIQEAIKFISTTE